MSLDNTAYIIQLCAFFYSLLSTAGVLALIASVAMSQTTAYETKTGIKVFVCAIIMLCLACAIPRPDAFKPVKQCHPASQVRG